MVVAKVPYSPVPTVAARDDATPRLSLNTPDAAFGANVGQAVESLGRSISGAADELFQRGLALQQLKNETEAKEADTVYMIQAGQLHANYNALQGKDAVNAFPKYMKDLQELRRSIREGLSSDNARKVYDGPSLNTMGRTIFNGANHAAAQNKQWAFKSSAARSDTMMNGVYDNPQDEEGFNRTLRGLEEEARARNDILGGDEDQAKALITKETSTAWAKRIVGLAKTEPFAAQQLFEKNKERLHHSDVQRVEDVVRQQMRQVESRIISDDINRDLYDQPSATKPAKTLQQRVQEARTEAKKKNPNDPMFADVVADRVRADYNQHNSAVRDDAERTRLVVEGAIMGNNKRQLRPTTVEELTAEPLVQDAWLKLKPEQQRTYERILANNAKGDFNETPERRDKFHKLLGMAGTDPVEFLNTNIAAEEIPNKWKDQLFKLQLKAKAGTQGDPRTTQAMQIMQPTLRDLGITFDKDKDRYYQFRGAMQIAMEEWLETHGGKGPNPKEVREIGARLLQERSQPGTIFGNWWPGKSRTFEMSVPDDVKTQVKADFGARGLGEPTDAQIQQEYLRQFYKKLYETGGKKDLTGAPKPPMSR